jgi:P-type Cu2+ transporter
LGPVKCLEILRFDDTLWPGAIETVDRLKEVGLTVEIVSGDAYQSFERIARRLGVGQFAADAHPDDKISRLRILAE